MKQDKYPNIYGVRKNHVDQQRKIIVILCITICVLSVAACIILIKNMQDRKKPETSAAVTTAQQSAQVTTVPSSTAVTALPSDTTAAAAAPSVTPGTSASSQTITADQRTEALAALSASVKTLLDAQSGRYSVYYINLNNGETLGYKQKDPMVSASSIKIAYNTYLYKKAADGTLSMDEEMAYNSAPYPEGDLETGTGTIQTSANGTKYSLSALSKLSVTISDNCATNMILRKLGGIDAVNSEYMVPISAVVNYRIPVTYTDYAGQEKTGKQRTSATDLAMYAKNLYILYKAAPASYEQLMTDLCTTEYTWGIPAGVPDNYKVAHKVGFNPAYGSNNDVGIVFAQEDYVLCVMTESGSDSNGQAIIGQVSKLFSDYITGCYS
ncbi:MAG: serine hydrolase [Eubacteriales bacterium]